MTQPSEIILDLLRAIRSDISVIKSDMRDIKARFASLESYTATLHGDQVRSTAKLEDLSDRIGRLEARAGIIDEQ